MSLATLSPELQTFASRNPRQLRFAECIAVGTSPVESYLTAGYSEEGRSSVKTRAGQMLRTPAVQKLVQAIREAAANDIINRAVLSVRERREFLARIVRTPIGQVDESSDLCQSYKIGKEGEREYKMPDKLRALELDAKLSGDLKETQADTNVTILINAGNLAALQTGYKELKGVLNGRN